MRIFSFYRALEYFVQGSTDGENLNVSIMTNGGNYGTWLDETHLAGGSVSNSEWRMARITLNELGVPESSMIESFGIGDPSGGAVVYLDDIMLTVLPPPVVDNG